MNLMFPSGKRFPKIGIVITYFGRAVWSASVVEIGWNSYTAMVVMVFVSRYR